MVSSDMASSSLEAAIDDARLEPAEQEDTAVSGQDVTCCWPGGSQCPASIQTGHPGQSRAVAKTKKPKNQKTNQPAHGPTREGLLPAPPYSWAVELLKG